MRDRRLLVVAVALALVFSAAWLWRAADDQSTSRTTVPAGQTGRLGAVTYRLDSLQTLARTPTRYDEPVIPADGAVLVLARISYDAAGTTTFFSCTFELVAGDTTWSSEFGYFPPEPDSSSCPPDTAGTVAVLFEIPARSVQQVQGIAVANPGGTQPILSGTPA